MSPSPIQASDEQAACYAADVLAKNKGNLNNTVQQLLHSAFSAVGGVASSAASSGSRPHANAPPAALAMDQQHHYQVQPIQHLQQQQLWPQFSLPNGVGGIGSSISGVGMNSLQGLGGGGQITLMPLPSATSNGHTLSSLGSGNIFALAGFPHGLQPMGSLGGGGGSGNLSVLSQPSGNVLQLIGGLPQQGGIGSIQVIQMPQSQATQQQQQQPTRFKDERMQ